MTAEQKDQNKHLKEPSTTLYCFILRFFMQFNTVTRFLKRCLGGTGQPETAIGPLQDPVTWYGINYAGTQWDSQNKGTLTSPARLSFV